MISKDSIVTVIGGSGFLGTYVIQHLAATKARIYVVSRNTEAQKIQTSAHLIGQFGFINADVLNFDSIKECIANSDYVINLVGILFPQGKQNFENLHYKFPAQLAQFCKTTKVKKLIHISALGVEKIKTSKYALSKVNGEKAVLANFPNSTIIKPSVIFGPEDKFINTFNLISKLCPIIPVIKSGKLQPVYVGDVARLIVRCLNASPQVLEVAGVSQYTLKEIVEYILSVTHRRRLIFSMPSCVSKLQASVFETLRMNILTRDHLEMLKHNNILSGTNGLSTLGLQPTLLESVVPNYIV